MLAGRFYTHFVIFSTNFTIFDIFQVSALRTEIWRFAFNSFLRFMLFVTNFGIFTFSQVFKANTHFAYPSITKWIPRFRFT